VHHQTHVVGTVFTNRARFPAQGTGRSSDLSTTN
jgi:hypothetical protein